MRRESWPLVLACPLACLLAAAGCEVQDEPEDVRVLLEPSGWAWSSAEAHPWSRPPADTSCPEQGYGMEGAHFEVRTEVCEWGTWTQAASHDLEAGDLLSFEFFHLDLLAPEPAEATVELGVGHRVLWSRRLAIPSPAAVEQVEIEVEEHVHGPEVWLHVHNHGSNSYRFGAVTLSRR